MKTTFAKLLVSLCCGLFAACAIITVNVYFPEKDVKQAYKSLDEMLLKQDEKKAPEEEKKAPEEKPQSMNILRGVNFSLIPEAYAQGNVADELAIELSSMPEVLKAYDEMRERLPRLDALRESGAVGESSQGLVIARDKAKLGGNEALMKAENENRKTVITGMAKAILKINKQKETKAALNQVLGQAAKTYADTKRDAAKPGWWVQLANGRWVQK